jgi:stearoyl-CoA desaturase (delta-9 desaturase)
VLLYHGSFAINSLAHTMGRQRYLTGDDSRNSLLLALLTFGEGWHNNHHHYQSSTRQGFHWWEIDGTYHVLKLLSWLRLVWDLRAPPPAVITGAHGPGRTALERSALRLAESFPLGEIVERIRVAWAETAGRDEVTQAVRDARTRAEALLARAHLPSFPSVDELRARARELFVETHALEEIVERARRKLAEAVAARLASADPLPA